MQFNEHEISRDQPAILNTSNNKKKLLKNISESS